MNGFDPETSSLNWKVDTALLVYISVMAFLNGLLWTIITLRPRGPATLGALIPEKYFNVYCVVLIVVSHFYGVTSVISSVSCFGQMIFAFLVYVTLFLTQELRLGRMKYLTDSKLRTPMHLVKIFRSFQVLHSHIMSFLGIYVVICNATFVTTSIYLNFVLLNFWEELESLTIMILLWGSIMVPFVWSGFLDFGRVFFVRGKKMMGSWSKQKLGGSIKERKVMKKFIKSCQPILISYGNQFVIGKLSVPVFFRGVIRGTQRTLLAAN